MDKKIVNFKEIYEKWGSRYVITEGKFKGYALECKTIVERVYPLNDKDDVGLPRFDVSHHTVIRVLPPRKKIS
jgi:hypothetical protein